MAYTNFIPKIWTAGVLAEIRGNLVAQSIVNSSYSGEIRKRGDTVHIRGMDSLSVQTDASSFTYTTPSPTDTSITVDQAGVAAFTVDELDAQTTDIDIVSAYTGNAGRALAEGADTYVLGLINTTTFDSTAVSLDLTTSPTATGVYQSMLSLKQALDTANAPRTGRFIIVSPDIEYWLLQSNLVVNATPTGDQRLVAGSLGRQIAGFEVYGSNNFANDTSSGNVQKLFAGVSGSIGYADIVGAARANEAQGNRAVNVDVAHYYGAKVLRDTFLVRWDVKTA